MKKTLLSLITITFFLCEASFSGGGIAFATPASLGNGVTWEISGTTLTIGYTGEGSGEMPNTWSKDGAPWYSSRASITTIVIKDGVTSIGKNAFYNCSAATIVQISSTVTSIGTDAFYGCSKLTRVNYQKNTINSTNATSAGMWAKISFATDKANPLYYAKKLYVVKQQGSASYALYEASDVTFASPLTKVSQYVFINCTSITSATLNSCITEIETSAFKGCSNLSSIKFGNSNTNVCNVTSVAQSAFSDCTKLSSIYCYGGMEKWLNINFEKLIATPFYSSTAANRCLYIDGTNASNKVTTPTFTQNIPAYSFYKNTGLTSVTISNTVSSVGNQAFSTCPNLASVTWDVPNSAGSVDYTGSSYPPFVGCSGITSFTIGSSVVKIPRYLCYGLSGLTSITIPSLVNSIGSSAFGSCSNLATLYYEGADVDAWSNIEIGGTTAHPLNANGGDLYIGGVKQTNITLTNATIKQYAFYKCTSLTSVTLNSTVQTIQRDAFEGCANLTKANCQSLEGWCAIEFQNDQDANPLTIAHNFYVNDELQTSLNVSESILSIGNYAFYNGTCFSTISLYGSTTFGAKTFYGCVTPTIIGEVSGSFGEGLTWRLDEGVLYIEGTGAMPNYSSSSAGTPWYAYKDCITAVVFGNNITAVGNYAFSNFSRISSISWGGVTSIGTRAFEACTSLTKLELSSNISSLADYAFYNCTGINYIISANTEVPTISTSSFTNIPTTTPLYVPYSALESYNDGVSNKWNRFTTHYPYTGNCGTSGHESEVTWLFNPETSTLTISGTGAMTNFGNAGAVPWYSFRSEIKSVVLESGVTTIGNYAFYGCNNASFTSISIPEGVTSLGNSAFYGCTYLASVTLPSTLLTIGSNAFHSNAFTSIAIPEGVATIGATAFVNCTHLATITIPRSVTSIYTSNNSYTFNGCTALRTVNWNAEACADFNKKSDDGHSFTYFTPFGNSKSAITTINFGEYVRIIPSCLCQGMTGITSVTLPASVQQIHQDAFNGCTGLESITIPANVTTMQGTVFEGCTNITSVTTNAATPPTIQTTTFPAVVESSAILTVPYNPTSRRAYSDDSYWSEFSHILPYILSFDLQDHGEAIDEICVGAGRVDEGLKPADPTETGYTFDGWFSNEACTTPFTFGESGTVVNSDLTLFAKWSLNDLVLNEGVDNSDALEAYDGQTTNVTMTRSLTNSQYNTFCLPFSLDASQMTTAFGADYDLEELTDVTYDGEVLGLVFTQREALEAGKPYLLQPANNVSNPSFSDVEIDASTPNDGLSNSYIEFHGVYSPTELTGGNKNLLFLGAGNELFWPSSTGDLKGFRAYFEVKGSAQKAVRARIVKKEDTATGIDQIINDQLPITNKFLRNGELLILRDGKTYNAQGMLVE